MLCAGINQQTNDVRPQPLDGFTHVKFPDGTSIYHNESMRIHRNYANAEVTITGDEVALANTITELSKANSGFEMRSSRIISPFANSIIEDMRFHANPSIDYDNDTEWRYFKNGGAISFAMNRNTGLFEFVYTLRKRYVFRDPPAPILLRKHVFPIWERTIENLANRRNYVYSFHENSRPRTQYISTSLLSLLEYLKLPHADFLRKRMLRPSVLPFHDFPNEAWMADAIVRVEWPENVALFLRVFTNKPEGIDNYNETYQKFYSGMMMFKGKPIPDENSIHWSIDARGHVIDNGAAMAFLTSIFRGNHNIESVHYTKMNPLPNLPTAQILQFPIVPIRPYL